jgi:hypothetical protein
MRDTATGGALYINDSTGSGTSWVEVVTATPGSATLSLQASYVGGNTIVTSAANGDLDVSGTEAISLDASSASNFTVDSAGLSLGTTTSGAVDVTSAGIMDLDAAGALSINSSGGAINVGDDANTGAINIGTGAAARTITIGNSTGATGIVANVGTGELAVNSTVGACGFSLHARHRHDRRALRQRLHGFRNVLGAGSHRWQQRSVVAKRLYRRQLDYDLRG